MAKRNIYKHSIDLNRIRIKNSDRESFAEELEKIEYRGYEVEDISDGRKIVIVKPGGKQSFGRMRKEDFFVFIYNPNEQTLWQITHKQIRDDLVEKAENDREETINILQVFERVYNGEEPDSVLQGTNLSIPSGENPEALIKAYKWIWGQEDVNYPTGKGRAMSWEGWEKDGEEWNKTGTGLKDLLEQLREPE
ncbi:MAG: hypothetical protein KAS75_05240 [Planctomycetes bacterium]|nr:hypothetical protein [Planctomycetota bacterium]